MVRMPYGVCPLPGKKDEDHDPCDQASAEARNPAGLPLQPLHLQELPVLNGMGRALRCGPFLAVGAAIFETQIGRTPLGSDALPARNFRAPEMPVVIAITHRGPILPLPFLL